MDLMGPDYRGLPADLGALLERAHQLKPEGQGPVRAAAPIQCRRCLAWTVAGIDGDRITAEVFTEPVALSVPSGEAWAVLVLGRLTFGVRGVTAAGLRLDARDPFEQQAAADGQGMGAGVWAVLAEHRCGWTQEWPSWALLSGVGPDRAGPGV